MSPQVKLFTFSFFVLTYMPFLAAVSFFSNSYKPVGAYCMRSYPGSVNFLPDHSGGISVSCVLMVFYILLNLLSFDHYCCIYFLFACHFSSQTRIGENR